MKILDLYCGTKSWSKPFEGKASITSIDINYEFEPTLVRDILSWDYIKDSKTGYNDFDVIFASPPCNLYFSNMKLDKGVLQFSEEDFNKSVAFVNKTIEIINYFKPKFWLIENPRAKMRYIFPYINHIQPITVDYCMYGVGYKKPTDLWTNIPIIPKRCNHKTHSVGIHSANHKTHVTTENEWAGKYAITIAPHLAEEVAETVMRQLAAIPPLPKGSGSLAVA